MKYIKKALVLFFSVLVIFSGVQTLYAADVGCGVYDYNDKLTDAEEDKLNREIDKLADDLNINIAVVITGDKGGKSSQAYADDFYDEMFGINTDGVLLLLDDDGLIDHISTSGSAINKYREYTDPILENMHSSIVSAEYASAIEIFLDELESAPTSELIKKFLIGGGVAAVISVITGLIIAWKYKNHAKYSSRNYEVKDKTNYTEKSDRFLREYTTKTKIESSSGGGGGTHRSSSGGTHGGSSRHR